MKTQVRRITPLDPEYWQDDSGQRPSREITYRSSAYVPALPVEQKPTRRIAGDLNISTPQQAVLSVDLRTTAVDRAHGFNIETGRLATIAGLFAVVIACVGYGHTFMALGTLLTFGVWFTLVYFVMWGIHRILTPEFVALLNAVFSWVYIFRRG